jgi:exonuclease V gamma subunit
LNLEDLTSFLNDPVKTFARQQLGILRSDWEEDESGLLEVKVSALKNAALRRNILKNGALDEGQVDELFTAMTHSGYLPPEYLGAKKSDINLYQSMARHAAEAIVDRDPVVVKVDFEAGPWRIVDTIEATRGGDGLRVLAVIPEVLRPYRYIGPWLRALTLAAVSDESLKVAIHMIVIKQSGGTKNPRADVVAHSVPFTGSAGMAQTVLREVLGWYESNLTSPIPFSKYIHEIGKDLLPTEDLWGVGEERSNGLLKNSLWQIVFGNVPLDVMKSDNGPLSLVKFGSTLGSAMTSTFEGFEIGKSKSSRSAGKKGGE